jgi:hypothetical protein
MPEKALDLLHNMTLKPDEVTLAIIFSTCAQLSNDRAKQIGKKFLKQIPKDSQQNNILLTSALNMLMKFGDVKSAENIFGSIMNKGIVTYNAMIKGKLL